MLPGSGAPSCHAFMMTSHPLSDQENAVKKQNLLYLQMRSYLLELIERNKHTPHYRLPSENQLAIKFGASRISARHAFDTLEADHIIYRQRGRGAFIAPSAAPAMDASSDEAAAAREDAIALIVPRTATAFYSDVITGVWEELERVNLRLSIFLTGDDQTREVEFLNLAHARFRGALLIPSACATYHEEVLRLVLSHYPLVLIDRYLPGLDLSCVSCDHYGATYRAVEFLQARGHEKIGFVGQLVSYASSVGERCSAFDRAMQARDPSYPASYKFNTDEDLENFDALFAQYMRALGPTAIISTSHMHASSIMRILESLGLENSVELMLYDNEFSYARHFLQYHPFIIDQQPRKIGRAAAQLVYNLAFQNAQPSSIRLKEQIIQI